MGASLINSRRAHYVLEVLATRVASDDGVPIQDKAGECARDVLIHQPEGNCVVAETSECLQQRHLGGNQPEVAQEVVPRWCPAKVRGCCDRDRVVPVRKNFVGNFGDALGVVTLIRPVLIEEVVHGTESSNGRPHGVEVEVGSAKRLRFDFPIPNCACFAEGVVAQPRNV